MGRRSNFKNFKIRYSHWSSESEILLSFVVLSKGTWPDVSKNHGLDISETCKYTAYIDFQAAKTTGQVLEKINKVAVPVAIAIDTVRVGSALVGDIKNDTTRNTVKTATTVAAGW